MVNRQASSFRWVVLGLSFLLSFVTVGWLFLGLPIFLPAMREDLEVGIAAMQLVFGAISFALIFTNFLGGVAGVRFSLRRVVGAGSVLLALSALIRGLFPTYAAALLASVMAGAGVGLAEPNFIAVLSRWFPSGELGMANGIRMAGVTTGAGTAQGLVAPLLMDSLGGWQTTQLAMGSVVLGASLLWFLVYRDPAPAEDGRAPTGNPPPFDTELIPLLKRMFSTPDMVLLGGIMVLVLFSAQSFMGMLPAWLDGMDFVPSGRIGFYSSLVFWFSLVGQVTLPGLSDRVGRRKPFVHLSALLALGGVLVVSAASGPLGLVAAGLFGGLGGGALFPLLMSIPGEHPEVGAALSGLGVGFLYSVGQLGGTVGPPLSGWAFGAGGILASVLTVGLPYVLLMALVPGLTETGPAARSDPE